VGYRLWAHSVRRSVCCDMDSPEARPRGFAGSVEDLVAVLVVYFEFSFVNVGHAVRIAQLTQTKEVVGESGNDVSCSCTARGDARDGKHCRSR